MFLDELKAVNAKGINNQLVVFLPTVAIINQLWVWLVHMGFRYHDFLWVSIPVSLIVSIPIAYLVFRVLAWLDVADARLQRRLFTFAWIPLFLVATLGFEIGNYHGPLRDLNVFWFLSAISLGVYTLRKSQAAT